MARGPQSKRPSPSWQFTGGAVDVAAQIRTALKGGGSTEHAAGVQQYFKQEIKSHGWYTADLRRQDGAEGTRLDAARDCQIRCERAVPYLMKIRGIAPRLVLRTACETLPIAVRKRILESPTR